MVAIFRLLTRDVHHRTTRTQSSRYTPQETQQNPVAIFDSCLECRADCSFADQRCINIPEVTFVDSGTLDSTNFQVPPTRVVVGNSATFRKLLWCTSITAFPTLWSISAASPTAYAASPTVWSISAAGKPPHRLMVRSVAAITELRLVSNTLRVTVQVGVANGECEWSSNLQSCVSPVSPPHRRLVVASVAVIIEL